VRIEQLEYLAEVARLGSFRRAAEALHISQPALSGAVRSLERELGMDLLERGRHGSRVSDSGRDLLPHILTVLDSVDRLRQSAGEQRQSIRQVRVGTVNTATVPLLAPAIRLFREIHHATQVEVIGAQQAQIQRAILGQAAKSGRRSRSFSWTTTRLSAAVSVTCWRPSRTSGWSVRLAPRPRRWPAFPRSSRTWPCWTSGSLMETGYRCAGRSGPGCPRSRA